MGLIVRILTIDVEMPSLDDLSAVAEVSRIGLALHQDADGEAVHLFSPDRFEEVARIVQVKKKKRISAAHLQKFQKAVTSYRKMG